MKLKLTKFLGEPVSEDYLCNLIQVKLPTASFATALGWFLVWDGRLGLKKQKNKSTNKKNLMDSALK